jgi:hypothetical protein
MDLTPIFSASRARRAVAVLACLGAGGALAACNSGGGSSQNVYRPAPAYTAPAYTAPTRTCGATTTPSYSQPTYPQPSTPTYTPPPAPAPRPPAAGCGAKCG